MRIVKAYKLFLVSGLIFALTTFSHTVAAQESDNYAFAKNDNNAIESITTNDQIQQIAIKTNLAQWAVGVSNIGVEIPNKNNISIDIPLIFSPYTIKDNWKLKLLILQPEARYWFSESALQGHFVGIHAHAGYFNVAVDSDARYQNNGDEPLWGFGLSYGYDLPLCKSLNLEFNIGAGYSSLRYDIYYNVDNGAKYGYDTKDYWGITRVGISLSYIINPNK